MEVDIPLQKGEPLVAPASCRHISRLEGGSTIPFEGSERPYIALSRDQGQVRGLTRALDTAYPVFSAKRMPQIGRLGIRGVSGTIDAKLKSREAKLLLNSEEPVMSKRYDRKTFLKNSIAATTGIGLALSQGRWGKTTAQANQSEPGSLPRNPLGRTGHDVTIYSLGGEATVENPQRRDDAVEIVNRALDLGVNYIDTAAWYGKDNEGNQVPGASETNIGLVMKERRDEVFLATKSHDYTYDGAMRLFENSLHRLQTDYIDLYQHHFLGGFGDLEQLRQNGSAREAFEELKDEGVIGNIGVTGHSARILSEALEDYPYDCALITINAAETPMDDTEYLDSFFSLAQEKEVGVIAMKVANRGALLQNGVTIEQLLSYTMSHPVATTIVGISETEFLEENVRIASAFEPLSDEEMNEIREMAMA